MELIIPCFIAITEQDPDAKTFAEAGCTLLVNEHPDHFGLLIGGESNIITDRVDACLATSKSIRLKVTIDDEDVTDGLTGAPTISHHFNTISSFSLTLAKAKYSPLADNHIDVNKVVVITAFLEGHEFKIFTGLIDTVSTKRTKKFQLSIKGRGYGKKLRNKRMTLISVQEAAETNYRGSIIKYLAGKAGITDVNVPQGDRVTIDHSFQDQFIWDMIQKECEIEGWFVRFDEEAGLQVGPRIIKTNEAKYPNPDWDYGENKFVELGLDVTDKGIINKVVILGAIFEEEVITVNEIEVPPYEPVYDEQTTTINKSFSLGEIVTNWSYVHKGHFVVTNSKNILKLTYDGGDVTDIVIANGVYSGTSIATRLEAKLDEIFGSSSTVSYDSDTRKFTIDVGEGFTIAYTDEGSNVGLTFGFNQNHSAAQSIISDVGVADFEVTTKYIGPFKPSGFIFFPNIRIMHLP